MEYHRPGDLIAARSTLLAIKAQEEAAATGKARVRAVKLYHSGRGF